MNKTGDPNIMSMERKEFEALIRHAVQDAVRAELYRILRTPSCSLLEYWEHEGPDDPAGDAQVIAEALELLQQYEKNPEGWRTLEEFEAELAEAEHNHDLPD